MFKRSFFQNKFFRTRYLSVFFVVLIVGFFLAGTVNASGPVSNAIATFLGWIIFGIVWALGQLLVLLMEVLVWIAQWSTFISAPAVNLGWKIVRDICNMFFVVIMLVIAFATVLRVEKYNYQKLLPKLIIMAILINFSKMICGLIIDVSQVVMLTFVNSFKDVAGSNLTTILGLDAITTVNAASADGAAGQDVTAWSVMGSYVLALIFVIISLITITTMVVMLAIRIVMIWIYVVLSPMAYLLAAFPDGQSYSGKWWSDFTKNVIVGPILAFFIWLSFAALGNPASVPSTTAGGNPIPTNENLGGDSGSLTAAGSPNNMLNFVISIAMLYGGLQISQTIGGAAGGMAGKGISAINQGKGMITKPIMAGALAAGLYAKGKGIQGAKWTGRMGKTGLGGLDRMAGAGVDKWRKNMNPSKQLTGTPLASRGLIGTGVGVVTSFPGKLKNQIKSDWNKDDSLNQNMRTYLVNKDKDSSALLEHNGKKYENVNGKFQERDESGNLVANSFLKDSKGREVTEMSRKKAAWQQAWRDTNGKAESESSKKQEKEISEKQQQMADSNLTVDEMLQKFTNVSTSATEKMALAMTLAAKGAFKDQDQIKSAKAAVGNNYVLGKKINDEIDKNQAHLNYDFQSAEGVAKFRARVDLGKIDTSNLKAEALKDPNVLKALEAQHGADFLDVLKTNTRKGGSKSSDSLIIGLKGMAATPGATQIEKNKKLAMAASISGKLEETFTIGNNLDTTAITHHFANSDAKDVNKISVEEIRNAIPSIKTAIVAGLDVTKLSAMQAAGAKTDTLRELIATIMSSQGNDRKKADILANAKLRPLIANLPPQPNPGQQAPPILNQYGNPINP